jgi:hypothetical protein
MKKLLLIALLLAGLTSSLRAAFWRCELPGGSYMVNLAMVASVSSHEYVVDGISRVTELTIGTSGSVVARFYYIELMVPKSPVGFGQSLIDKAQEKLEDASDRTGVEPVWKKVVKNYPTTTHAHTVEYRLDSIDQLGKLQKSIEEAWRNNRDGTLKLQ